MKELESYYERKFNKAVESAGGLSMKFVSPNFRGVPDRIVIAPNGVIKFAEIKREGGKLRKLQEYRKAQFQKYGVEVAVIDGEKAISEFVNTLKPP